MKKNSNIKSQQNNKMKHTTKAAAAAITHTLTRKLTYAEFNFFFCNAAAAAAPPLNVNVNVDGDSGGEYKSFNSLRTRVY